ncbi:MAG: Maf family protein [Planctomycetes bacterium]|nr:Maf family protein [Planctomycetota bacterium]
MLILASASAARRALLRRAGFRFKVVPAKVRELRGRGRTLRRTVLENARRKAAAVPGERVLAADTMIAYGGKIYGKPSDRKAAVDLLARLAGKTHVLGTGIVLRDGRRVIERYVETRVTLRAMDRAAVARLVSGYDPRRFAGGYAIRRRDPLIERIEGSFTNVVGLPMEVVGPMLHGAQRVR